MPTPIDRAEAALESLTLDDLDALPPAVQRRFAELCYHWFQLADSRASAGKSKPKSGLLVDLQGGRQA